MALTNKADLRKQFLEKRDRLKPAARTRDSALIRQRLLRHTAWEDAGTIAVYVSFGSEVETHKLIEKGLTQRKLIVVPWVNPKTKEMAFSELLRLGDLAPGFYKNIFEPGPSFRKLIDPTEIELALVPGVVFDREGGRIGMGGGYFDRLLPQMTHAFHMGLAYSTQVRKSALPLEAHDVRVNAVMTEEEFIEVRP
jgi:5-formyltetrahydrofolate cyclo-ligase